MAGSSFNNNIQHHNPAGKITVALERISEAFRVLLWEQSKINGLSPIQIQILTFLLFHDAAKGKISYLAAEFNMTKATISDSVKVLLHKGYVTKSADTADTRSFSLLLTEQGRTVAEQSSAFAQPVEDAVALLDVDNQTLLLQNLMLLIASLNKKGVISVQRMCFSCRHYDQRDEQHYCTLLNRFLADEALRIDCPEHKTKPLL